MPQTAAETARVIDNGEAILGIEFGSTRIKATIVGPDHGPLASGAHGWENRQVNGIWTYTTDDIWSGLAACYADLKADVSSRYGVQLSALAAAGFSGMMHGYVALNESGDLLVPFRTWRNNITERASEELTELLDYPIPQRWSIAHLYQAILNGEEHVSRIARLTTLAGYVHWKLTGRHALGAGEASGMFPVDPATVDFDRAKLDAFDRHVADRGLPWKLRDLLPDVVPVGETAGTLTEEGAKLLDSSGALAAGVPLCPPEGDAETGMVATNSIRPRTGNVSAGTSVFAMLVLEKPLSKVHPEIDLVLTPDGLPVGMAHSNNCTSDFNAWIALFGEAAHALGSSVSPDDLYGKLMPLALEADADAGGLLAYGYVSGEHITGFSEGRPVFARSQDAPFTLPNFIRAHLFSALGALRTGMNILTEDEGVSVEEIRGHGGFFKTPEVGQRIMAAATQTPVSVLETAGEGGAWGMALLAAYMVRKAEGQRLADFLDAVFAGSMGRAVAPDARDVAGFNEFFARYTAGLPIEAAAVKALP
ncbi:MAG: xylulokinase [Spirochaetota bacterium]